jgi:EAL domain-containing protein (putative c-di-GMP-specific phosphodiesterase class I)
MREGSPILHRLLSAGGLRTFLQPIVDVSDEAPQLHSVECLVRGPAGTNMETPNVLFDYIRFKGEELRIDRACVRAILAAPALYRQPRFSLNVHACTLGRDESFVDFLVDALAAAELPISRVTIEVVEHAPPYDTDMFLLSLARLRDLGFAIALDDVGLGQSNFKMIVDTRPDYLKIDRYFVTGLAHDTNRQAVVGAIAHMAFSFGAKMIAEGVETDEDREALRAFGITLMQGFLYSRPVAAEQFHPFDVERPVERNRAQM